MPFGLKNAPLTCQRLLDNLLSKCSFARAYIDDIIIFSTTITNHIKDIETVLEILSNAGLKINHKKCMFAYPQVLYLGYNISINGISVDKDKINAILQWKKPDNKK